MEDDKYVMEYHSVKHPDVLRLGFLNALIGQDTTGTKVKMKAEMIVKEETQSTR